MTQDMGLAIIKAAHHVEQGLRFLYARLFEVEGRDFEWFVLPIQGGTMGVNPRSFAEVEGIVMEADPEKLLAMGDRYYHAAMWLAFALVQMTVHHTARGDHVLAWERLASAHMWMGFLNGRMRREWEEGRAKSKAGHRLNDTIHAENRSSKDYAMDWYDVHRDEYPNDDERALAIAGKIVPHAFSTVRRWITEHRSSKK
jgi:UDP-N-acetylglucosamine 2-epimerase